MNKNTTNRKPSGCTCRVYPTHRSEAPDCPIHGIEAHRARLATAATAYARRESTRRATR